MKTSIVNGKTVQFGNLQPGRLFTSGGQQLFIKNFSDDAYNATQLGGGCRHNFATDYVVEIVSEINATV